MAVVTSNQRNSNMTVCFFDCGFTDLFTEGPSLSLVHLNLPFIFHLSVILYPSIIYVSALLCIFS